MTFSGFLRQSQECLLGYVLVHFYEHFHKKETSFIFRDKRGFCYILGPGDRPPDSGDKAAFAFDRFSVLIPLLICNSLDSSGRVRLWRSTGFITAYRLRNVRSPSGKPQGLQSNYPPAKPGAFHFRA